MTMRAIMTKKWNVTGLYKSQRDRVRGSRRKLAALPKPRLILVTTPPDCPRCGWFIGSNGHAIACATADEKEPQP